MPLLVSRGLWISVSKDLSIKPAIAILTTLLFSVKRFLIIYKIYNRYYKESNRRTSDWKHKVHAFAPLRKALITSPILIHPDFYQEFLLYTDASNQALGYILGQIRDNEECVIVFGGRKFTKMNWTIQFMKNKHYRSYQGLRNIAHTYLIESLP